MTKKTSAIALMLIIGLITVSCETTKGIDIAKIIFDIVGYIFTAVIGALGGAKIQKVAIIKDKKNNYKG